MCYHSIYGAIFQSQNWEINKKKTHLGGRIYIEGPDKIIVSTWNKSDNRFAYSQGGALMTWLCCDSFIPLFVRSDVVIAWSNTIQYCVHYCSGWDRTWIGALTYKTPQNWPSRAIYGAVNLYLWLKLTVCIRTICKKTISMTTLLVSHIA